MTGLGYLLYWKSGPNTYLSSNPKVLQDPYGGSPVFWQREPSWTDKHLQRIIRSIIYFEHVVAECSTDSMSNEDSGGISTSRLLYFPHYNTFFLRFTEMRLMITMSWVTDQFHFQVRRQKLYPADLKTFLQLLNINPRRKWRRPRNCRPTVCSAR